MNESKFKTQKMLEEHFQAEEDLIWTSELQFDSMTFTNSSTCNSSFSKISNVELTIDSKVVFF